MVDAPCPTPPPPPPPSPPTPQPGGGSPAPSPRSPARRRVDRLRGVCGRPPRGSPRRGRRAGGSGRAGEVWGSRVLLLLLQQLGELGVPRDELGQLVTPPHEPLLRGCHARVGDGCDFIQSEAADIMEKKGPSLVFAEAVEVL